MMATAPAQGSVDNQVKLKSDEKVNVSSLSKMTGFPVDFIKKELILDQEELSMEELRLSMAKYLEKTSQLLAQQDN